MKIRNIRVVSKGKIYSVEINDHLVDIMITWHALDKMELWNLDIMDVLDTLLHPEEVLEGHSDRYI